MTWKLYAVVSAGAFVATYLMSSPVQDHARSTSAAAPASARQPAAGSDIEELADRLQMRRLADVSYRTPGRDPFRFQSRPMRSPVVAPAPLPVVEAPPPAPVPVLPLLTLSGVATDLVDGEPRRAAILSAPAGVLIVRQGESVAGLYTVVSIGDESVELESTADGSRRTLRWLGPSNALRSLPAALLESLGPVAVRPARGQESVWARQR